jgi:hypothetical protein
VYVTPSSASAAEQTAIVDSIRQAAAAIGLWHGPVHAECRVNGDGVFVLEVAARPIGGLCARALRFEKGGRESFPATPSSAPRMPFSAQTDADAGEKRGRESLIAADAGEKRGRESLEELLLRHALGGSLDGWQRERAASGVMMIPIPRRGIFRRVSGVEQARAVAGIDDVRITAKVDQRLIPLPEGASYLGFIFARAEHASAVTCALREAHACLRFDVDAELPIVASR